MLSSGTELTLLGEDIRHLRGNPDLPPDASIIIPVNAQGDLENVQNILSDIVNYGGLHALEVILVINNYQPNQPPTEIETFESLGLIVVSIPDVRRPGEAVGFSARIPGIRDASSEHAILFDSDCRIPNPTALIDWYIRQFRSGVQAAYTNVGYYGLRPGWSIRFRVQIHHATRWLKRVILRIPTNRGSNYAVNRSLMLEMYDRGMLADEMNVGPSFKSEGARVMYSGSKELTVLTSGRMFTPGWKKLPRYFMYRLRYNLRVLPVRVDASRYTGREDDPVRRYVSNRPAK